MVASPASAAVESRWITVDGLSVYYRATTAAPAGAPQLVLVHGFGVASAYMVPLMEELSAEFRAYALDLPGFGMSGKPLEVLDIPGLADWLVRWMDALGLEQPVVFGNSAGCQVVIDFAVRYPGRCERLILSGPTMDRRRRAILEQARRLLKDRRLEPKSQTGLMLHDYLHCGPRRFLGSVRHALRDRPEHKLPRISVPTLVLRGGADPLISQEWAEEVTRLLPDGRLHVIQGKGHTLNYNSPTEVAALIRGFVRQGDETA